MKISVVIPTRNRPKEIRKALHSLAKQTQLAQEVILVDASDDSAYVSDLISSFASLSITAIHSAPSVCAQRNAGIAAANHEWILLLDDDIELETNYLAVIANHMKTTGAEIGSGILMQKEGDAWVDQYPVSGWLDLVFRFVFQLPIWGSVENVESNRAVRPIVSLVLRWYLLRGNTRTLAGWPLVTSWSQQYFTTEMFSLGANIVKKKLLVASPYDEVLDASGIGDNYGVMIAMPGKPRIHVLTTTRAFHHRSTINRISTGLGYYRRVLALHYFLKRHDKNFRLRVPFLLWSLCGNFFLHLAKWNLRTAGVTLKLCVMILFGTNPYWAGHRNGSKKVSPSL